MKKKLYIVKKEVWATNLKQALKGRGKIYEIAETNTEKEVRITGFNVPNTPKK